jgi:hypothetical protein
MYVLGTVLHLIIAAMAVGAAAGAGLITNSFVAVGAGAGAVQLVKQARSLALQHDVPSDSEDTQQWGSPHHEARRDKGEEQKGTDDAA